MKPIPVSRWITLLVLTLVLGILLAGTPGMVPPARAAFLLPASLSYTGQAGSDSENLSSNATGAPSASPTPAGAPTPTEVHPPLPVSVDMTGTISLAILVVVVILVGMIWGAAASRTKKSS